MKKIWVGVRIGYGEEPLGSTKFLLPANEVWGKVMFLHLSGRSQGKGWGCLPLPPPMQTLSPWMQTSPGCRPPCPLDADPTQKQPPPLPTKYRQIQSIPVTAKIRVLTYPRYGQRAGGTHPTGMHCCTDYEHIVK